MKKLLVKIQIILLPLFFMVSCGDEKIVDTYVSDGVVSSYDKVNFGNILENQSDTNNIMPLNVGNRWIYAVGYQGDASQNCEFQFLDFEYLEVEFEEKIDGGTWYYIHSHSNSGKSQYFYYTNTTTGLFCKLKYDSEPFLLCPRLINYNYSPMIRKYLPDQKVLIPLFDDKGRKVDYDFFETPLSSVVEAWRLKEYMWKLESGNINIEFEIMITSTDENNNLQSYRRSVNRYAIGVGLLGHTLWRFPGYYLEKEMVKSLINCRIIPQEQ